MIHVFSLLEIYTMAALIDALNSFRIDSIGTIQFCQDHYNFRWCFVGNIVSDFQSGKNTLQQQQLKLIVMQMEVESALRKMGTTLLLLLGVCSTRNRQKSIMMYAIHK